MKKLPFLLFLGLMVSFTFSYGQLGVKVGANISTAGSYGNSEEGESVELRLGYQVGVFYAHELTDRLGLMVELNYESRGTVSKKDYNIGLPVQDPTSGTILGIGNYEVSQEINSSLNYVNLPLLVTFKVNKLRLYGGPNVGVFIGGSADFERTIDVSLGENMVSQIESNIEDIDWTDYESFSGIFTNPPEEDGNFINSLEIGINLGAMYNVTDKIFVDLRVSQGLTDVTNNQYDNSIYPAEDFSFPSREDVDRNISFQLSVGVSLF